MLARFLCRPGRAQVAARMQVLQLRVQPQMLSQGRGPGGYLLGTQRRYNTSSSSSSSTVATATRRLAGRDDSVRFPL